MKILLDTTYLLPTFGIEVKGLTSEDILKLRRLVVNGNIELYCSSVIWPELLGKVFREINKQKKSENFDITMAIRALFNPKFYKWIKPGRRSIELAYNLRRLGHPDMIDNILYALSVTRKMIFLSMDLDFKNFLIKRGFSVSSFLTHNELFEKLTLETL
ncbi:MAG: PIN domain-containing protein [Candidatus Nezhaarchaeales archaeon]